MKSALIVTLFGISNAYDPSGPDKSMCCAAKVATTTAYSACKDVMSTYRMPSDQMMYCNKQKQCQWAPCSSVGYCVNSADSQYYDEMVVWEQSEAAASRRLLEEGQDKVSAHYAGWGNGRPLPTPRPTNPPRTPRPTVWKAPKTPRPTSPPKTPRPTSPPKTPRPTEWKAPKTPRPTDTPRPTRNITPRPTRNITPRPTRNKTPRPTFLRTPRPTFENRTPRPTFIRTPRPTFVRTPRPTFENRTPRPTFVRTPRPTRNVTPRPTRSFTPRPTRNITPRPTRNITPRPTRNFTPRPTRAVTPRPTRNITPRPTRNITPRPTRNITPRPTRNITPRPTVWKPSPTPRPTNPPKTPRPTVTYIAPTPKPTQGGGWGSAQPEPTVSMTGCAKNVEKNECKSNEACVWKSGYPPLAFSEDSDYQLLEEDESFFAVDGSVIDMVSNMDSNMLMISGVLFAAVLIYAIWKFVSSKKGKYVADYNTQRAYGSFAEGY